jgi:hypothetical protein
MTSTNSADHNDDLMPTQEKLEWVTPKISLMEGGDTDGKPHERTIELQPKARITVRHDQLTTTLSTPANPNSTNGSAKTLFHAVRP